MDHIDLNKYLTIEERRPGRPRYDQKTLLKIILFAFMENGYASVREIEKYCKTDIRYMWLLQDNPPPSHMTIDNFMKFTMYEKESKNEKYRNDPYRAVNFPVNESGLPVCPNGKEFHFIYSRPVKGNKYGRTEVFSPRELLVRSSGTGRISGRAAGGLKSLFLEFGMISCGFNLHKFHLKKVALRSAA